jgi:hypothetical protein
MQKYIELLYCSIVKLLNCYIVKLISIRRYFVLRYIIP